MRGEEYKLKKREYRKNSLLSLTLSSTVGGEGIGICIGRWMGLCDSRRNFTEANEGNEETLKYRHG